MGASAFVKRVDFREFAVNVKTIAPVQKLYQFGHAIWWNNMPMPVFTFLDGYDFSGKTVVPFTTYGNGLCIGFVHVCLLHVLSDCASIDAEEQQAARWR